MSDEMKSVDELLEEGKALQEQGEKLLKKRAGRPKGSKNKKKVRGRNRPSVAAVNPNTNEVTLESSPRKPKRRRNRNIGEPNYNLRAPTIPGYVTRWVNDPEGKDRLRQMYDEDWDFVEKDEVTSFFRVEVGDETVTPLLGLGDKVWRQVGVQKSGAILKAYLMKKPVEYYEADYKEKQEQGPGMQEAQLKKGRTGIGVEHQHGDIRFSESQQ